MRKLILNICLLLSLVSFSQEKVQDESIRQTETDLVGYWEKLTGSQEGKKYYVEKKDGQLFLSIGEFQKGGLELKVSDKILVKLVGGKTMKLQNFILENNGISELIFLDSNKLILKNGGELFEFKKLE